MIWVTAYSLQATAGQKAVRSVETPQGTIGLIVGAAAPDSAGRIPAGLRFRLKDGWHIYWQNPGDSGGPPTIRRMRPDGVTAGPFDWPTPERIPAGPFINYGYHDYVVLPFSLRVDDGTVSPTFVDADVRWLVCKDVCVSVRSGLSLNLPLSAVDRTRLAEWQQEIRRATDAVPQRAPRSWRTSATSEGDAFIVTLDLDHAPSRLTSTTRM